MQGFESGLIFTVKAVSVVETSPQNLPLGCPQTIGCLGKVRLQFTYV